jgi:regulator of PEP synthase PpsR (kinase-PPPase family)
VRTTAVEPNRRPVFFVSDSTGITAETFGNALLAQFPDFTFRRRHLPFVDSVEAARSAVARITRETGGGGPTPLVFLTVRDPAVASELATAPGEVVDLLGPHLTRLEKILGTVRTGNDTAYHRVGDLARYHDRIDAVEFSVAHDDATSLADLDRADLILLAPSRCGKTPTAMYLALQHGLRVANYPLTEDDTPGELPAVLRPHRDRLFGLTTTPARLSQVRGERRPGSGYASLSRCRAELRSAEQLYRSNGIPSIDSHAMSVEEMASIILTTMDLRHT